MFLLSVKKRDVFKFSIKHGKSASSFWIDGKFPSSFCWYKAFVEDWKTSSMNFTECVIAYMELDASSWQLPCYIVISVT